MNELFEKQKELLDTFLKNGNIDRAQYNKSLGDLFIKMNDITIRRNEEQDDKKIEDLIRSCLVEYGGTHEGCAWTDPNLGCFSKVYTKDNCAYWVAVDPDGEVLAGVGIGPLDGVDGVCELQKMYSCKSVRGMGLAQRLLDIALEFAEKRYDSCYLETFDNMVEAQGFYKRNGFVPIEKALGDTGHYTCPVRMLKTFKTDASD